MEKFAILTDSGADVPLEYRDKYPIYIAPLHVNYQNSSYLDGVEITPEEVTKRFAQEIPKTSLPSVSEVEEIMGKIKADGYDKILIITISSGLSGTFNAMRLASEAYEELDIKFVDSKNIGIGAGMLVALACTLIKKEYNFADTYEYIAKHVEHTKVFFCIPTLEYLRKGGRIGLVESFIGTALKLHPIITCNEDGIYKTVNKARGWKKTIDTAIKEALAFIGTCTNYNIAVAHADAEVEAKSIKEELMKLLPKAGEKFFGAISPALTVHTGPQLIGIGVQRLMDLP